MRNSGWRLLSESSLIYALPKSLHQVSPTLMNNADGIGFFIFMLAFQKAKAYVIIFYIQF